ncbi:MAG: SAM-dependent methyltransferase [Pseudomonadota bacterium]
MQNTSPPKLFSYDRLVAGIRRANRIAKPDADFLARIAADVLAERLNVTNREFQMAADVFSRSGRMRSVLHDAANVGNVVSISFPEEWGTTPGEVNSAANTVGLPDTIPFSNGSLNLATSVFGLHWSNDLPGILLQIRTALAPDGLFLAALPGAQTLNELRQSVIEAETELTGSVSLRVDPFGEIRQVGSLLQRAGFALPVVDTESFTVRYSSMKTLIDDLRAMGVSASFAEKSGFGPRDLFDRAERIYSQRFSDPDGRIRATYEMVFLSGWSPDASQQRALKPGSAKHRLQDFLGY